VVGRSLSPVRQRGIMPKSLRDPSNGASVCFGRLFKTFLFSGYTNVYSALEALVMVRYMTFCITLPDDVGMLRMSE